MSASFSSIVMLHLRNFFRAVGLDVRLTSKANGDPLIAIQRLNGRRPINTIIDIGANVGQSALNFQQAFSGSRVHSFEPVQKTFQAGRKNTSQNPNITWHNLAVGAENRSLTFYSRGTSGSNSIHQVKENLGTIQVDENDVQVVRLDDFVEAQNISYIDLLKTDTEGFDLDVFKGAEKALKNRAIGYILCEVGFSTDDTKHSNFSVIVNYLERFGYRLAGFYGVTPISYFQHWGATFGDALFTAPQLSRCVSIKNQTDRGLHFRVVTNGAETREIELAPDHGIFLYEPLSGSPPKGEVQQIGMSITGPDGATANSLAVVGFLAATINHHGTVTTHATVGGDTDFGTPDPVWLSVSNLKAQMIADFRSVEVQVTQRVNCI